MKALRRIFFVVLSVILIAGLWVFRPYRSYDSKKVIPELGGLKEPYKSVQTISWADGGSLGVRIVDADGAEVLLCISAQVDEQAIVYEKLYVGDLIHSKGSAREVPDPYHFHLKLLEILRNAPNIDQYRDGVIATMSGRWRDYAVLAYRRKRHGYYADF